MRSSFHASTTRISRTVWTPSLPDLFLISRRSSSLSDTRSIQLCVRREMCTPLWWRTERVGAWVGRMADGEAMREGTEGVTGILACVDLKQIMLVATYEPKRGDRSCEQFGLRTTQARMPVLQPNVTSLFW